MLNSLTLFKNLRHTLTINQHAWLSALLFKHNKVDIGTFCDALEHSKSRSTYSIHKGLCTALGKKEIMRYMGQIWFYSSSIAGATSQIQYYNGDDIKSDYAHTFNSEMKQNKTKKWNAVGGSSSSFL